MMYFSSPIFDVLVKCIGHIVENITHCCTACEQIIVSIMVLYLI